MRGGLDDALDKLARRDELRRRATGESPATPPAVTELVEAIAAVVAKHPSLAVTVGVEGVGDPVLLQFAFAGGTVQVRADRPSADRPPAAAPGRMHADFEIHVEDPEPPPRGSHDDQDRFGPTDYDYAGPPAAERPFVAPQSPPPPPAAYAPPPVPPFTPPASHAEPAALHEPVFHEPAFQEPVFHEPAFQEPVFHEPAFQEPVFHEPAFQEPTFQEPVQLPYQEPVPFQAGPAEETELAARRLAAMLRDNPTLLDDTQA
ncbi:hypothetical protein ACTOB_008500 [Actinoplanes oblitus]|uniref:Uncharacterized protein n=1 Tax=Actinoplanes oblitus TaxID=3040509 RepID=A0ABY8WEN4_9ACTN|nr:hypothetical protein [Actinoplanes oblitus]WIM96311.1 hypothetical protein ACTOB_008500 [Actinoplanes oblitus]